MTEARARLGHVDSLDANTKRLEAFSTGSISAARLGSQENGERRMIDLRTHFSRAPSVGRPVHGPTSALRPWARWRIRYRA